MNRPNNNIAAFVSSFFLLGHLPMSGPASRKLKFVITSLFTLQSYHHECSIHLFVHRAVLNGSDKPNMRYWRRKDPATRKHD